MKRGLLRVVLLLAEEAKKENKMANGTAYLPLTIFPLKDEHVSAGIARSFSNLISKR